MTLGRIVIQEVAQQLEGTFIDSDTFFHFVQDINSEWFLILSEQDEIDISKTEYSYLLDLPLEEYIAPPTPPIP
jgi:shikimate kinase